MKKKSCRYLQSYLSVATTRHEAGPGVCIISDPHLGEGGSSESAMVPFERAMVVSSRISIVTIALYRNLPSNVPTLKSIGVGHFGSKFREEGVDRWKSNFIAIWERLSCAKEIVSISCVVWAQCSARTGQTDRQTDRRTVTSIAIGKIALPRCRLKTA